MIKITKKIASYAAIGVLVVGGGYWGWQMFGGQGKELPPVEKEKPKTDTIVFQPNAPQLTFLKVEAVQTFPEPSVDSLNARLDYNDNVTARVFSPVSGRVVEIAVDAGDRVKKGDPLLKIDSPDFAAAMADRAKADADLVHKKQIFERAKQLLEAKGIAQRDLEIAEADYHQAEAEAQRALARLNHLTAGGKDKEFILRAPIDGIVSERQVSKGTEVRPDAQDPLFFITDPKHLWVFVDLPEQYLDKVNIDQTVLVEVDAYPGETFESTVTVIGEVLDPVTRRIQVRCDLNNNHDHKLKAEMFARVTPIRGDGDRTTMQPRIPNSAIFAQGVSSFVFVETARGQYQRRKVELGVQERDVTYIKHGLKKGERVVVTGALLLNSELSGDI